MLSNTIATATAVLALASAGVAAPTDASLTTQLRLADSTIAKYRLLPKDEDFVFDFSTSSIPFASASNFPALVGTGISFTLATIPACSLASLHIHPRAAEAFAVISGRVITEAVPEAGVTDDKGKPRIIRNEIGPNQMTIFPAGVFHTQMNTDCNNATIVAAFPSEDPGSSLIIPESFNLSDELLTPYFGKTITAEDLKTLRETIPQSAIFQVEECVARCAKN